MADEDLEDVLEEFYGEGTFDSSGVFRLSAEKAREKLADFQLADPYQYVTHIVSAGLMAGATILDVKVGYFRSELWFADARFDPADFQELFSYLMWNPTSDREWALHELAIGAQAASRAQVLELTLSSPRVTPVSLRGGLNLKPLSSDKEQGLRVSVRHRRSLFFLYRSFVKGEPLPEFHRLKTDMATPGIAGTLRQGSRRWSFPSYDEVRAHNLSTNPLAQTAVEGGWVALGEAGGLGVKSRSRLVLYIRGRRYELPLKLIKGQVRAQVQADHLALDLSQSGPLRNAATLQIYQRVSEAAGDLQLQVLTSGEHDLTDRDQRTLARQVARSFRSRGYPRKCLSILERLKFEDSRRASIHCLLGEFELSELMIRKELGDDRLPEGLRPRRLLDLAVIQAHQRQRSALSTWQEGYDILVIQHMARKGHLVAEAVEKKLPWILDLGFTPEAAWQMWEEAFELKLHLGAEHPRMAETYELGSYLMLKMERHKKALEFALRSEEIRGKAAGLGNPVVGQSLVLRALAEWDTEKSEARQTALRRLAMMETVYGPSHPEVAASCNLLALFAEGEKRETLLLRAQIILQERNLPVPSPGQVVVCFRGWFHSRSQWDCCWPLLWAQPL
jgi:hypothetical protein